MLLTLSDGSVGKLQACCLSTACGLPRWSHLTLLQCLCMPVACSPALKRFLLMYL